MPIFEVEGCEGVAKVAQMTLANIAFPIYLWAHGWVTPTLKNSFKTGYEIEEKIRHDSKETIGLVFEVPANCTKVSGKFKIFFK